MARILVSSLLFSLIAFAASPLVAQTPGSKTENVFYSIQSGYSPNSSFFLGKTPNSQTYYTGIYRGRQLNTNTDSFDSYITFGIIPYLGFDYEKRDDGANKDYAWGMGISPLGYLFTKKLNTWSNIEFRATSGLYYINKTFPTDKGRRINYSFDLSLGFETKIAPLSFLSFGYKFHHISNAQTGNQNPGLDSNILFISIKKFNHAN